MKVLFIRVIQSYMDYIQAEKKNLMYTANFPPLGLLYLGSALLEEGHKVEIYDFLLEDDSKEALKKSLLSADAIGFTVTGENLDEVVEVSNSIKESEPHIPIIIGGAHCTFHPNKSLYDVPSADVSVEGDGDFVIKEIINAIEGRIEYNQISGVYYRDKGKIRKGKKPIIIKDLDSIPFPSRNLIDKYNYGKIEDVYLFKPKMTSMVSSRGCQYNCRFCSRHAFSYDIYRQRSSENVVKEFQEINEKYSSVVIVDDNFLTDKKRVNQILDEIIQTGVEIDIIILSTRADSADKELYRKMKKAGVIYLGYGLESGNQDVLDYYRKGITLDHIKNAIKLSREMNFITHGNFILGAPIETEQHIKNTINFACSLPLDIAIFQPLYYMHGSDLWGEAIQKGNIDIEDGYSVMADSQKGLGQFSETELEQYCRQAFNKFYMRPSYFIKQFLRSLKRKDFNLIKIGFHNI